MSERRAGGMSEQLKDFFKHWQQKFPDSDLTSSAWIDDVKKSLGRHQEKIVELTRELEHEELYCTYLESLLREADDMKDELKSFAADEAQQLRNNEAVLREKTSQTTDESGTTAESNVVVSRGNVALSKFIDELSFDLENPKIVEESAESDELEEKSVHENVVPAPVPPPVAPAEIVVAEEKEKPPQTQQQDYTSRKATNFVTVIEVKEHDTFSKPPAPVVPPNTSSMSTSFKSFRQADYENVTIDKSQLRNSVPIIAEKPLIPPSLPAAKKKTPPKPPPKIPRPPTEPEQSNSPSNSLERNVKPSELKLLKKPTIDVSSTSPSSNTEVMKSSSTSEIIEEFNRKITKSESFKSTQSSSGSTRSRDTKSSTSGSLERAAKNAGSRESLFSSMNSGNIQDKIKSFESVSSINSDTKIGQISAEPYYDTVPHELSADDKSDDDNKNFKSDSPERASNYVNIDYFLKQSKNSQGNRHHHHSHSTMDSDDEIEEGSAAVVPIRPNFLREESEVSQVIDVRISSNSRNLVINQIISSIITSETFYVECLEKMTVYMKAIRATLTTSQPVINEEDFQKIFFKIEDLHNFHTKFLAELRAKVRAQQVDDVRVGELFKNLADNIELYAAFLHNYGSAIDTVKKCSSSNPQFKSIVSNIILNSKNDQSLTLDLFDLLHKPVARVQKNALVLSDLLQHTPDTHPDYPQLKQAQKITRNFLSEFNVIQTKSFSTNEDKALRRLIRNSVIVELADGNRKLRHLFLFNDVIACAKYKSTGRERLGFDLKWFIPLKDVFIVSEESPVEPKENSPVNIILLKSQASTVRDQIMLEQRGDEKKTVSRVSDKHRKKLKEIEANLVLASPNLLFKIGNKANGKVHVFFLSSDFERTLWCESILTHQKSCNLPGANSVHILELQAWITACQKIFETEMGSYLLRNTRDELFVGDLHFTIDNVVGLSQPADLYCILEVDSYGHYFRKAKTKIICYNSAPKWNERFILELEGSQNVRVLLYEDADRPVLRGRAVIELNQQWLTDKAVEKKVKLTDSLTMTTFVRFVASDVSLRRVPTTTGTLFGSKLNNILKREKRDIPYIVTASIREVDRRGMNEVGIYRVSGSALDLQRIKKAFESNAYEAEQLLKEVDIHSVTGNLKSFLRELPEALFTDQYYQKFFDTFNQFNNSNENARIDALQRIFEELPQPNKMTISFILDHLNRINQSEIENKMSLHNLATVFGPTLLRPAPNAAKQKDLLESSTVDVMASAGIIHSFLQAKLRKQSS